MIAVLKTLWQIFTSESSAKALSSLSSKVMSYIHLVFSSNSINYHIIKKTQWERVWTLESGEQRVQDKGRLALFWIEMIKSFGHGLSTSLYRSHVIHVHATSKKQGSNEMALSSHRAHFVQIDLGVRNTSESRVRPYEVWQTSAWILASDSVSIEWCHPGFSRTRRGHNALGNRGNNPKKLSEAFLDLHLQEDRNPNLLELIAGRNATPAPADPSTTTLEADANASTMALLTNQFGALLDAVKTLNVTMDGVKSTLVDHGTKFDVLIRDALKNDQPYEQKELEDETTCRALYDMVMAKTKEKADEWNGTMDVTLIFIALFSAVLTAFLVPATQNLLPAPTGSGNSNSTSSQALPLPPRSDEAVCAFYYLSLITAIIIAVLCALGRQWVRKLTVKPDVGSWRERTMWLVERMKRAESWLKVLMEVLYWMLLSSIGLFMAGLLYQLWNVSHSFEARASILLATWALGVVLIGGIVATMIATTYHSVRYQGSVFEGLVSRVIVGEADTGLVNSVRRIWTWSKERVARGGKWWAELKVQNSLSAGWTRFKSIRLLDVLQRNGRRMRGVVTRKTWKSLRMAMRKIRWTKLMKTLNLVRKTQDWIRRNRVRVQCKSKTKLLATYLDQIAEASDPTLLDRAVASLTYGDWVQYGGGSVDQLQKVYTRLMATDTSFRVKETINAQVSLFSAWFSKRWKEIEENREDRAYADRQASEGHVYFIAGSKEREEQAKKEEEEKRRAIQLTKFLISQRKDGISFCFTPTWENCTEILDLISLPFDAFIAKCVCIHDHNINLGYHQRIFPLSVSHCLGLFDDDKTDDVTRILSHLDLSSAVRSFVLVDYYNPFYDGALKLIIGDRKPEVLHFLNEFLSTPRNWSNADPGFASAVFLIAAGSPPQFPSDLDLSPIIAHVGRHPSWWNWRQASEALIGYLGQCDISTLSDPASVHHFLQQCVHLELHPPPFTYPDEIRRAIQETREAALTLSHQYEAFFTSNIPLPPSPPLSTSDEVLSSDRRNSVLEHSNSEYLDEASSPLSVQALDDPGAPEITPLELDPSESLPSSPSSSTGHHAIDMTDTER
ncbi:hypothetical protein SISNIDRAFT_538360 [Sistotremastrum niveocremeum HHB9708]|uniref:DUF6535 domain-containing protein n=1 Tax=Sistotremastrum niveocremeum HHB9708 TaxID=1314777 RepID=A0A164MT59_9AGAM|nr:hypothetical protein SISNIDRAFT_538360 [Sistotremastrum niveocremeum HHB9708]